jgi:ribA/ribD-fused uncharacterized protein
MEVTSSFETKIALTAKDLSKDIDTIDKLLEEKIRTQYEGRCSRNGYVVPGTVKLISRSIGVVEKGRFTGDILYYAEATSKVLQPPDGFILIGEVIRKNKMGMYVNYKDAIRVMIPRDLHIGDEDFESVNVGESVRVEIKKSRYQVNDTSILSVGVYRGRATDEESAEEVPVAERPAMVFATKPQEDEEEEEEAAPVAELPKPTAGLEDIYFYSTKPEYREFSNFHEASFTLDDKEWPTVEHYFQAAKFQNNPEYQEKIRRAASPAAAKKLGASKTVPIRSNWDTFRIEVMRKAIEAKFSQNEDLMEKLLETGNRNLVEASPTDTFWGIGKSKKGQNMLGKLLMELRSKLSAESDENEEEEDE